MEKIEVVFKIIKNIVYGLVIEGLCAILMGVLILIYPNLLGILVGILLIITGIIALLLAIKLSKYIKLTIKV